MRLFNKILKSESPYKYLKKYNENHNLKPPWNVLFFGSDKFSLASLKELLSVHKKSNLINNLEVVTSIKKKRNPIETLALQEKLVVHNWPISEIECKRFDVGIVVSFGYLLPDNVIKSFPLGMLNVHASLLPRWRGAAPIIYAIANGDKKTGVTIMKIKPYKFDIGEIVTQASIAIPTHMKLPDLYVKLADLGARTLIDTLNAMPENLDKAKSQPKEGVTFAPRVNSTLSQIHWNSMTAQEVYNLYRALVGIFELTTYFKEHLVKLSDVSLCNNITVISDSITPGFVKYCKEHKCLQIQCKDGNWISVSKIGINGKKMSAHDFNNGFLNKNKTELCIFR